MIDKQTVTTCAESSALEAQKDHELTLAWHAAGLVFAVLSYKDHPDYERFQDSHGGQLELIDESILLAAQEIEEYRKEMAPDCKWGAGLPHLYDVWDSVAKAMVESPGQGGTLRQKTVREAIVAAIVVDYLQLSKTK